MKVVSFVVAFAVMVALTGRAVDHELARAGMLSERGSEWAVAGASSDAPAQRNEPAPRSESVQPTGRGGDAYAIPTATASARAQSGVYVSGGELYQGRNIRWWARRAVQARKDANARGQTIRRLQREIRMQHPSATGHWLDGAFLCLYRYERGAAGWQTDTGNGYRGGLQMDASFSYTYGPAWAKRQWGSNPAYWPAAVQMTAAMHAWTTRGFGPWPTTRRMCGL